MLCLPYELSYNKKWDYILANPQTKREILYQYNFITKQSFHTWFNSIIKQIFLQLNSILTKQELLTDLADEPNKKFPSLNLKNQIEFLIDLAQ